MRYLTSGESHGPQLTVIVEGIPANLEIKVEDINKEMFKRQGGYGRGRRMQIEKRYSRDCFGCEKWLYIR